MDTEDVGTINDVITYFNENRHLFENDGNEKAHMERVMAVLTQENMEILQKQFQLYSKGLQLPTFIYLIKKLYIPDQELSKYFFVSDLIKFFQAIDINGDGHLEWSQFTQYIIQNIRVVDQPKYKNKMFEENEIIFSAYSKISNEYRIIKTFDLNCQSVIKKIIYIKQSSEYYVQEAYGSSIRIFDSAFNFQDSIDLVPKNTKSAIFDFSIDQESHIVGIIFESSFHLCNMKIKSAAKYINQPIKNTLKNCNKVDYLPLHKLWALMLKTGQIQLITISYRTRVQLQFQIVKVLNYHESMITDISQVIDPLYIVTSSMDGQIKLYSKLLEKQLTFEHISEQTNSIINDKKKKGILGIGYSCEFGNYLLAFGFSPAIYIYSLDISLTKGYVGKYFEHSGSIMTAKFLKSFPYVLSFDDKMNLRIWDFRKFQTIQFINCEKNFINPSCLQLVPELSECLICEKKITQFRAPALEKKSMEINEFHNIFDFKFCTLTNSVFIFTSNDVRVYNYYTGVLKKVFAKLHQSNYQTNITAAQFGYKARKFFIGDAGGFVREYCSETGDFLQDINPGDEFNYENKQIVKLIFLKEHSLLVCCSLDGRVMIYERIQTSQFILVRDIRDCHEELVCAGASPRYCLLATGGEDGSVNIWSLQKYSLQTVCVVKNKPISIAFSPIHPIMIIAQETGYVNLFYVRPYEKKNMRYKCFAKISIQNMCQSINCLESFSFELVINSYFPKNNPLIHNIEANHHLIVCLGTSHGKIVLFNFNQLLKAHGVEENHQIFVTKSCVRCEIQIMKSILLNQRNRTLLSGYSNQSAKTYDYDAFPNIVMDAHESGIGNILLSKENSAIFSKANDKKIKIWGLNNELTGIINFSTFKKAFWRIPEVNFYKKIQAIETTIYSIKLIENRHFTKKQEQSIKVHLLLNEYLKKKEKQQYFSWFRRKNVDKVMEECQKKEDKKKYYENSSALSQNQFNQIYNKLISSIQKQLGDYKFKQNNTLKEEIGENQSKRMRSKNQKSIKTYKGDDGEKSSKFLKKTPQKKVKIHLSATIKKLQSPLRTSGGIPKFKSKVDHCFELFGHKQKQEAKRIVKHKNMLFNTLTQAKKKIETNENAKKKFIVNKIL